MFQTSRAGLNLFSQLLSKRELVNSRVDLFWVVATTLSEVTCLAQIPFDILIYNLKNSENHAEFKSSYYFFRRLCTLNCWFSLIFEGKDFLVVYYASI